MAEIKRLTIKDKEASGKSVLEYRDVRDAVALARDEGRDEGREEGIKKGKIFIVQKCLQKNMPLDEIEDLTGFSKEQIILSYKL